MTDNQPLISVIVPIYNVEPYLRRCVDSIIAQTYTNLEILLVDDGSPDNCPAICDEYAQQDQRVRVIHKENGGLSDARNAALDVTTGEWIVCVDSDDYVTPDYVSTLYGLCLRHNCKMSVASCCIVVEDAQSEIRESPIKEYMFARDEALAAMFNHSLFDVSAWCKLYHRSLFSGVRYPKGYVFEDFQTTYKLMLRCDTGVAFSSKQTYYYLLRPDSIEGKFSERKIDSAERVFRELESHKAELSAVWPAVVSKLVSFCFHLILKMPEDNPRRKQFWTYVKRNRRTVITNSGSRLKTRAACVLSYFGYATIKNLFKLIDRRK